MYAPERQQAIVERARADGRVDVAELATSLDVTTETIRRDLGVLERHRALRRVHGGAIPIDKPEFAAGQQLRDTETTAQQTRIAKAALEHVPADGTILLDAGSTTARLAELLPDESRLTIVTNAPGLVSTLATLPRTTVLLLGGRLHGPTMSTVDEWTIRELADTHVGVAFLSTDGVSPERGLTTADTREAAVKRAMLQAAASTVLLAEHTTVGNDQLARFGDLEQLDSLITDSEMNDATATRITAAGPAVIRT